MTEERSSERQSARSPREPLVRITTGSPEFDAILGGGFPANSMNIVMGEPGSGKTIFAERLIFANATPEERPILFLTTLSEPLDKVVRYLQQFDFYEEEMLATGAIVYDSVGDELREHGIDALVPRIKEAIKSLSPKIIVIDSFRAIHDLSPSLPNMRRMLFELSGLLTAYETTALLVGEYNESMISVLPEFAVADSMIEFARKKEGTRDERYLRVLKLRGSAYLEGLHAFRITSNGLDVFPRLTSPEVPLTYTDREQRVSTGIIGLDKILGGGVWAGSSVLLEGPTGSGKTTVALQFALEGVKRGEQVVYVNFQENPTQLARAVQSLGWNMRDAQEKGLNTLYTSPVELQLDSILVHLFELIRAKDVRRVVIDAVGDLMATASNSQRVIGYLYALSQHFQVRRVSSIMTLESVAAGVSTLSGQISALSDCIWRLGLEQTSDRARRTLQVVKARGTEHDLQVKELRITSAGAEVL